MVNLTGKLIAITGATGFIGRYLVEALAARGANVVAVVRRPERAASLEREFGVEPRRADLADRAALARAFIGVDAVVANAALISLGDRPAHEVVAANLEGTRNVFEAMAESGVSRAVFISSAVAYRARRGHFYRERDSLRSAGDRLHRLNAYAVSKGASERLAWRLSEANGIGLTTARPHTVFGHGDRGTFSRWLLRFMALRPVSIFPSRVRFPAVYAGEFADAVCRMLERDVAVGRAYNIASPPGDVSYWDLMEAFRRAGGRAPRVVLPLPIAIERRYDTTRAAQDLDFTTGDLETGFRDMLARAAASPS